MNSLEITRACSSCAGMGGWGFNKLCRLCGGRGKVTITGRLARLRVAFEKAEAHGRGDAFGRYCNGLRRITGNPSRAERQRRDMRAKRQRERHD